MPGATPGEESEAGDRRRRAARRDQPPCRRRRVVPERDGHPRRRHARARRVARRPADGVDDHRVGRAGRPARLGRPRARGRPPTASAPTPRERSGTPASPDSGAPASPRAARCWQTIEADRGCFACMLGGDDGRTLYIVANRYDGGSDASDGIVLTERGRRRPRRATLTEPGPIAQYSPLITKYEPRIVPASFDFCRANLNFVASSSGTSIPSESLNPTARFPPSSTPYITLIDRPLS